MSHLLFMNLGGGEVFVILLVILIFFGAKRIPELAKGLGKGMREFKDAMNGVENEVRNAANSNNTPAPPAPTAEKKNPDSE
jgi:sec-independent protein translocase protein TatA